MSGPARNGFVGKSRYDSGYLKAGQPTPSIGLGVYGVVAACSRAGTAALAAGFAADFAAAGFFTTDFAAVGFFAADFTAAGFFAAFFGTLFFFAVFAMPRNLLHRPSIVKRTISPLSISEKQKGVWGVTAVVTPAPRGCGRPWPRPGPRRDTP